MEINVNNIPLDTVYRFDVNKYIRTVMLEGVRDGIRVRRPITDVFELTNEGDIHFLANGDIVKDENNDYSRGFIIKDCDNNEMIAFRISMLLQEVSKRELQEIQEEIKINRNKHK